MPEAPVRSRPAEASALVAPTNLPLIRALVDVTPDPTWIADGGGRVIIQNRAFARWWPALEAGLTPEGARGWNELRQRAIAGQIVSGDIHVVIDGIERTYAVHGQPAGPSLAAFTARDLTESFQVDASTGLELALTRLFASEDTLPAILTHALEFLCTAGDWDAAVFWSAEASQRVLRPVATWFASAAASERLSPRLSTLEFAFGHGVPGRAWAAGEVVWIADILEESTVDRAELTAASGLHCVVAVPLKESQTTTGVVEFFTHAVRPISARTRNKLARAGETLGALAARRRAEEERRQLLEAVERQAAEWMLTFDAIELPMFIVSSGGEIARVNRAARALAPAADLTGQTLRRVDESEPWTTLADIVEAVATTGLPCTAQITRGDSMWDVAASQLLTSPEGRVVVVMREISEIVRLQESVRRGEQLAALGELVAGVAHEVKNPVFGMGMTLDLLDEKFRGDADTEELLVALRRWITRLTTLMENLLEYGKTWTIDLRPAPVAGVLAQAVLGCEPRALDAGVRVDVDVQDGQLDVLMDGGRLVIALENLITNAIQHSPRGASVTVTVEGWADFVEFRVRDSGPGFPLADLQRAFQPFFTRRRGGTGLGLSIVQRIVEEHGGTVAAHNHAVRGAVVVVRLPLYRVPEDV